MLKKGRGLRKRSKGGLEGRGVILYFVLLFVLGLSTLRNGHGWLFFFGIFFPVLWLVGALMRPAASRP